MKIAYGWLKDFVAVNLSPQDLAQRLTMAGLEVKSWEERCQDIVFEAEITSNRPDWLSVIGVAREVAALTGLPLKKQVLPQDIPRRKKGSAAGAARLEIADRKDCPLYIARIIRGVKVGPSPDWLKKRIESVGCRSVNNVVDITNYVLFERGEPLHAFDLDTLEAGTICVRRAAAGEQILTIDGQQRVLNPEVLVIADAARPVAVAGVMGGKHTEVSEATTSILLEAALFDPVLVRRGRQRLGVQSEASYRFERGVDSQTVEEASRRCAAMIADSCGGEQVMVVCAGSPAVGRRSLRVDVREVNDLLNTSLTALAMKRILDPLGFEVALKPQHRLQVTVPGFRQDVHRSIDLVEEIARIHGYAAIPTSLPKVTLQLKTEDITQRIASIKQILVGLGLNEVITYSLVNQAVLEGFWEEPSSLLSLQNPLSQDQAFLRPVLMPSLVGCVSYNLRQQQSALSVFEIAKAYKDGGQGQPVEEYHLCVALCGSRVWLSEPDFKRIQDAPGFLHLKGILEVLCERLGLGAAACVFSAATGTTFRVTVDGLNIGSLVCLPQQVLERFDIKNRELFCLEISLEHLLRQLQGRRSFKPFSRFPGVQRDISAVVAEEVSAGQVEQAIRSAGKDLLKQVAVTNLYRGEQIPAGQKNLTISCLYRSEERTLNEEEVQAVHAAVIAALKERCAAQMR